jgi:hypothetical protein
LILLSDANILIDLGYAGGLDILTKIAPTEVLDVVLDECEDDRQPTLTEEVVTSGIVVVETERIWVEEARSYRSADLSSQDRLNLYYAKAYGRVLLAGDRPLRERCIKESVTVHGSLWLVEQAFERTLVHSRELCRWLSLWPTLGRRLPLQEIDAIKRKIGCSD